MPRSPALASPRTLARWLASCALIVLAVVVMGGYTRLTHSGLSIVEWQPIVGTIPPFGGDQWDRVFAKYQETPERQKLNWTMSLGEFKEIYMVEWIHRSLARLSGLVFGVPFVYLLVTRRLTGPQILRLLGILILGVLQAALGWYMVASGLVDVPQVSPYRLTAHLGLAALLLATLWWTALDYWRADRPASSTPASVRLLGTGVIALCALTILAGGLVAGTRAGFVFNTFPLMMGRLIPEGMYSGRPLYQSLFQNILTIQFNHRVLATTLFIGALTLWWRASRRDVSPDVAMATRWICIGVAVQITLGITTLLQVVPIPLGVAHQGWGLVVLCLAVTARHRMRREPHAVA